MITDIADTVTRRLLAMAEAELGPPPVPYLWLACGSQGRQEQTGVDGPGQLPVHRRHRDARRHAPISIVWRGSRLRRAERLRLCLLPRRHDGDEPAVVPTHAGLARLFPRAGSTGPTRWRRCWHRSCSTCARSAGQPRCSTISRPRRWRWRRSNSIFVAHMISNSLKHQPPLGLLRGLGHDPLGRAQEPHRPEA